MDEKQLKSLKELLSQFRDEYNIDSMMEFVYIPYILKHIDDIGRSGFPSYKQYLKKREKAD